MTPKRSSLHGANLLASKIAPPTRQEWAHAVDRLLGDVELFSHLGIRTHPLRSYQLEPVRAVVRSVAEGLGLQFAWVFARQSGKDEAKAQLYAYLLARYRRE